MTSLEVSYDPTAAPSPSALAALAGEAEAEQDRRWQTWLAKGRAHDVRLRRRTGLVAGLTVISLVTWAVWVLAR